MKAVIPAFAFVFCLFLAEMATAQNYFLNSSLMRSGRCGSSFSGAARQIQTSISIDEAAQMVRISYADGTSGYNLKIQSVKPSDDAYGPITYKLQPDGQGFHTMVYDRDPLRNWIMLMRADGNCIIYALD